MSCPRGESNKTPERFSLFRHVLPPGTTDRGFSLRVRHQFGRQSKLKPKARPPDDGQHGPVSFTRQADHLQPSTHDKEFTINREPTYIEESDPHIEGI